MASGPVKLVGKTSTVPLLGRPVPTVALIGNVFFEVIRCSVTSTAVAGMSAVLCGNIVFSVNSTAAPGDSAANAINTDHVSAMSTAGKGTSHAEALSTDRVTSAASTATHGASVCHAKNTAHAAVASTAAHGASAWASLAWSPWALGSKLIWWLRDPVAGSASGWADSGPVSDGTNRTAASTGHNPAFIASDAGYGNRPVLNFASNKQLLTAAWGTTYTEPYQIAVVCNTANDTTNNRYILSRAGSTQREEIASLTTQGAVLVGGTPGPTLLNSTPATPVSSPSMIMGLWNGASSQLWINARTANQTGDLGSNTLGPDGMGLGGFRGGNISVFAQEGKTAEVIATNAALTTGEIDSWCSYVQRKFGITQGA